jgi:Zn-dependent protease with chaperone function
MTSQRWLTLWTLVVGIPGFGLAMGALGGAVPELRWASIAAFILGAGLLAAIAAAATYAARNRAALAAIFAPGVKLTLGALFALILLDAAIIVYGVFVLEASLIGRVHIFLLGFIAIGALAGAIAMVKAGLSVSRRVTMAVVGHVVTQDESPLLARFVHRLADRMGARKPDSIVLGLEPKFYATSADVTAYPGGRTVKGQTLYLSLPLMRLLSKSELAAVVGHELGHFTGDDTRYSLRFYPVYARTSRAIQALSEGTGDGAQGFALLPAIAILSFLLDRFETAERAIGRDRELAADRAGASVSSPRAVASSLVKIGAVAPLWQYVEQAMVRALNCGIAFHNVSTFFARHAMSSAGAADVAAVLEARAAHPTDSHPSTHDRIDALGLNPRHIAAQAIGVEEGDAAIDLVDRAEAIERTLSAASHDLMLARGHARLPQPDRADDATTQTTTEHN